MPFEEGEVWGQSAVVAVEFVVDFVGFHEPTTGEVVVAFLDDFAEVGEDAEGHAGVDIVVGGGGVPPFAAADVVDEEVDVGGGAEKSLGLFNLGEGSWGRLEGAYTSGCIGERSMPSTCCGSLE